MPIVYTKPAAEIFGRGFKAKVSDVYSFFPELTEKTVICGAIRNRGCIQGTAIGWTDPPVFRLQSDASLFTIAHELTHLVQGKKSGIPHGEIPCDIWTIDRMPAEYLDVRPYYLLGPIKMDWHANRIEVKRLCRNSIELRESMRTYIKWLVRRIKEL